MRLKRWAVPFLMELLPLYLTAGGIAFALKLHYSRAGADALSWILAPTCGLVEAAGGIRLTWEAGAGFVSPEHRLIIGPACAGVNFLIAAFLIFFVPLAHRARGATARLIHLGASLVTAYSLTIVANAARIVVWTHLSDLPIYGAIVTPERLHRAEGAILFCLALLIGFLGMESAVRRFGGIGAPRLRRAPLVPLCWYPCLALGAPLLNGALGRGAGRFAEHAAMLLAICGLLALAAIALESARRRARSREP